MAEVRVCSSKSELLPCPFCGGEAFVRCRMNNYWVSAYHDRSCVLCDEEFEYPSIVFGSEAGAVKAWNRRTDDHEPTKLRWDVPVVRCRDCKSAKEHYERLDVWWCDYLRMYVNPDDYCAWGEKDDEKKPKEE